MMRGCRDTVILESEGLSETRLAGSMFGTVQPNQVNWMLMITLDSLIPRDRDWGMSGLRNNQVAVFVGLYPLVLKSR